MSKEPTESEILAKAQSLAEKRQWADVIKSYQDALKINPDNARAYQGLGDAMMAQEMWEEAIAAYQEAIAREPDLFTAYHKQGDALIKLERWEEAEATFKKALELRPNFHWLHYQLGETLAGQKRWEEAKEAYGRCVEMKADFLYGHQKLGKCLLELHQWQEARGCFEKAIALEPDYHWAYYSLGEALTGKKDWEGAVAAFEKAIEIKPDLMFAYHKLGNTFLRLEQWEKAEEQLRKAIELEPDFFWSYYDLGEALVGKKKLEGAVIAYQQAIEFNPQFSSGYYRLADALVRLERWEEAIENYKSGLKLPQNNYPTEIHKKLSDLLVKHEGLKAIVDTTSKSERGNTVNRNLDSKIKTESVKILDIAPNQPQEKILAYMEDGEFVNFLYETLLHRGADEAGLNAKVGALVNGVPRTKILEDIIKSDEFKEKQNKRTVFSDLDDRQFVEYIYITFLKRPADEYGLKVHIDALEKGLDRVTILEMIFQSQEFLQVNQPKILEDFSNQEFLHPIWEILLGRICDVKAEKQHLRLLDSGVGRLDLIVRLLRSDEFRRRIQSFGQSNGHPVNEDDSDNQAYIMGTDKLVTQKEWDRTLLQVLLEDAQKNEKLGSSSDERVDINADNSCLSDRTREILSKEKFPLVSIITSLYKGGEYIENFLRNITSGTIFEKYCELIIIDANSPEGEYEVIEQYMKRFNNIKYERTETVISIYEAWNLAIKKSEGKFVTNANLDDLRSYDCFEKQAIALLQEDCDVVYQNFYYSFTPNLPFHVVAKCNFKSKLPVVTKANMLQFNSPHNAPMWKKSLHRRVGLFDSRYKSAADYEFWLRCLLNDTKFWKIDEGLVVYYNNPTGISTRVDTDGVSEAINIQRVYLRLFGSNLLGMDRHDFIKFCQVTFGLNEGSIENLHQKSWIDKEVFLFQCFEQKLKQVQETKFYVKLKDVLTT